MRITMKADDFNFNAKGELTVEIGVKRFFEALDRVSEHTMADYMEHRMRSSKEQRIENQGRKWHDMLEGKVGGLW